MSLGAMKGCSRSCREFDGWRNSVESGWICRRLNGRSGSPSRGLGERWPAYRDDDGVRLRVPRMVDARSPDDIVALTCHGHAAFGEVDAKTSLDEEQKCCSLVVGGPFGTGVSGRVGAPLYFDIFCGPHALGLVHEVAEQPAPVACTIIGGVSAVPGGDHYCISHSIVGRFTRGPPIWLSRRSPCNRANRPSLLQATSPISSATSSRSRLE